MNSINKRNLLLILAKRLSGMTALCLCSVDVQAHVKWFVEFDISDSPQSLWTHPALKYMPIMLILASWGIVLFGVFDRFLDGVLGRRFTPARAWFGQYQDLPLTVARIGTGVLCLILWLMGSSIVAPELLYSDEKWIPALQLMIAFAILCRATLPLAGSGILLLYAYSVWLYGLFHVLDYVFLVGLGVYLILSGLPVRWFPRARSRVWLEILRYGVLYFTLVFAFLWSAVEKVAYPLVFHRFLAEYPFLTMGLNQDFFIIAAAAVEFALFFLLLFSGNGMILLALVANILITIGNIFFGKMDAIGHWPVNFILVMMFLRGPLPIRFWFFDQGLRTHWLNLYNVIAFYGMLCLMLTSYYGLHQMMYG